MRRASLLLALVACEKTETRKDDRIEPPNRWPVEAIACQRAAIEARSTADWIECMHPVVRADAARELSQDAQRDGFWDKVKAGQEVLDKAVEAQFDIRTTKDRELGDLHAKVKLVRDKFEAIRKDGRWYVIDPGL